MLIYPYESNVRETSCTICRYDPSNLIGVEKTHWGAGVVAYWGEQGASGCCQPEWKSTNEQKNDNQWLLYSIWLFYGAMMMRPMDSDLNLPYERSWGSSRAREKDALAEILHTLDLHSG